MSQTPKISVVIPLYNKQSSIQHTIKSVLNQTYSDFELIVVNDGSTDNSLEIVNQISDSRIRVVTQINTGESGARNRGIREAVADVIAFVDADDEWLPGFLEKIVHLRESYPDCKLYATAFQKVAKDPLKFKIKNNPYPISWEGILEEYYHVLITYTPFCASSVAIDKETLQQNGYFKEGIKLRGDMELWIRLSMKVDFAYSNEVLVLYHLDSENRVCDLYQEQDLILGEHLVTLNTYLRKNLVPQKMFSGADEYFTHSLFDYVSKNLVAGKRLYAFQLLLKWRFSRNYLRRWLQLLVYCLR